MAAEDWLLMHEPDEDERDPWTNPFITGCKDVFTPGFHYLRANEGILPTPFEEKWNELKRYLR